MIAILVGPATVGGTKAAAGARAACRPVADRTDIDASLAITTSATPAMRPRGKVLVLSQVNDIEILAGFTMRFL